MQKETLTQLTRNNRMFEQVLKLFAKTTLGGKPKDSSAKEETWTCKHCKAEKCFASRQKCYKCGEAKEPKVPSPPGLGSAATSVKPSVKGIARMEVEVEEEASLEDQIAEVEDNLKTLKGKTVHGP